MNVGVAVVAEGNRALVSHSPCQIVYFVMLVGLQPLATFGLGLMHPTGSAVPQRRTIGLLFRLEPPLRRHYYPGGHPVHRLRNVGAQQKFGFYFPRDLTDLLDFFRDFAGSVFGHFLCSSIWVFPVPLHGTHFPPLLLMPLPLQALHSLLGGIGIMFLSRWFCRGVGGAILHLERLRRSVRIHFVQDLPLQPRYQLFC